jgi:general stress protein 26
LKVIQAIPNMPNPVTEAEVNNILESKLNMQIATIDEEGYPIIQPTWFLYDKESDKIYTATQKISKKVQNIRRNPDKVYFSIDDEKYPYKGVKGRAVAKISEDIQKNLPIVEKINIKYLGTLEHPLAKMIIENTKNGTEVVIEIIPRFFSAWDFGKPR